MKDRPDQAEEAPQLVEGHLIRCPNCEELRNPLALDKKTRELKRFGRNEKYALELNIVYQCVKATGGCGHIFSPGDQRIMMAYLAGDLVPKPEEEEDDETSGESSTDKEVTHV